MPIYSFLCENCENRFDEFLSVEKRKKPTRCGCPKCGKKTVATCISSISIFSDSRLTANKKTGGDWNKLMNRMKRGLPKRLHDNLDKASSRTGRRFKG